MGEAMDAALTCTNVVKVFGGIRALRGVDLCVERGTVHALVGQNGSGKSTLIGVLTGRVVPTEGQVLIFGVKPEQGNPRASRQMGLVAIYQELTLVPGMSAEENVFLGMTPTISGAFVDRRGMRRRYLDLCSRLGVRIPPRMLAKDLSIAEGQILEIMRALAMDARIILLDEPTAALSVTERSALLRLMRELRAQGVTMVFISHNLEEVLIIADHVTVLRDGMVAGEGPVSDWDRQRLVMAILGDKAGDLAEQLLDETVAEPGSVVPAVSARTHAIAEDGVPILEARNVRLPGVLSPIDLVVRRGEIVGIGGLVGSGRTTLLRCLAGAEPDSSGDLQIRGLDVPWPKTMRQGLKNGVALIPEDRKRHGLILRMRAMDNIALPKFSTVATWGWLSDRRMRRYQSTFVTDFGFDVDRLGSVAETLSGGNQQKLLLARWRYATPQVLLADEPTRGVDVGAKEEILNSLRRFAADGIGVVIVSSELEEVSMVSDRVLVLADGHLVSELVRGDHPVPVHSILSSAFISALPVNSPILKDV